MWSSCYFKDENLNIFKLIIAFAPKFFNFQIEIVGKIHISTKKGKFE